MAAVLSSVSSDSSSSHRRGFAGYSGRKRPVKRAEQQSEWAPASRREEEPVQQDVPKWLQQRDDDPEEPNQLAALRDAGLRRHLVSTYTATGGCLGVAGIGAALPLAGIVPMVSPLIPVLGSLIPLFMLYRTQKGVDSPAKRQALMGTFAGLSGMSAAPLMMMSMNIDPTIVPMAFGLSCVVFGGATAGALLAPSKSMLKFGPVLGGGMMVLLAAGLLGMVYPHPMLFNVSLYGGLGLFTLYTAYDTQQVIQAYEDGDDDHIMHSVNFFINFMAIFKRMLIIVGMMPRD